MHYKQALRLNARFYISSSDNSSSSLFFLSHSLKGLTWGFWEFWDLLRTHFGKSYIDPHGKLPSWFGTHGKLPVSYHSQSLDRGTLFDIYVTPLQSLINEWV